ncbi:hypothetical protein K456DRAFT_1408209 [Colletotrichum gloeosporioides 23]|nr:hypothetical protein K456DRAFT_1408209 [Colletotrichum gloeosporioides 23]
MESSGGGKRDQAKVGGGCKSPGGGGAVRYLSIRTYTTLRLYIRYVWPGDMSPVCGAGGREEERGRGGGGSARVVGAVRSECAGEGEGGGSSLSLSLSPLSAEWCAPCHTVCEGTCVRQRQEVGTLG